MAVYTAGAAPAGSVAGTRHTPPGTAAAATPNPAGPSSQVLAAMLAVYAGNIQINGVFVWIGQYDCCVFIVALCFHPLAHVDNRIGIPAFCELCIVCRLHFNVFLTKCVTQDLDMLGGFATTQNVDFAATHKDAT